MTRGWRTISLVLVIIGFCVTIWLNYRFPVMVSRIVNVTELSFLPSFEKPSTDLYANPSSLYPANRTHSWTMTSTSDTVHSRVSLLSTIRSNVRSPTGLDTSFFHSPYFVNQTLSEANYKGNSTLSKKYVLFFSIPEWVDFKNPFSKCPVKACVATLDPSWSQKADAVVFDAVHLPPVVPARSYKQIWIAFGLESPYHHEQNYRLQGWRSVFNWTMTYRIDSDLFRPYGMLTLRQNLSKVNYKEIALSKKKSIAWIVSNCNTPSKRDLYVKKLASYVPVDIYGRCGDKICEYNREDFCLSDYRFYLSFENSLCQDYVTEKFFKLFRSRLHVIPVVRGGNNYKKYFPEGAFINTEDFASPEDLANYLKHLTSDVDAYVEMLKRKDMFQAMSDMDQAWCKLCQKLHYDNTVKTYTDFSEWLWGKDKPMCQDRDDS